MRFKLDILFEVSRQPEEENCPQFVGQRKSTMYLAEMPPDMTRVYVEDILLCQLWTKYLHYRQWGMFIISTFSPTLSDTGNCDDQEGAGKAPLRWCPFFVFVCFGWSSIGKKSINLMSWSTNMLLDWYVTNKHITEYWILMQDFPKKLPPLIYSIHGRLSRSEQRPVRKGPLCHNFSLLPLHVLFSIHYNRLANWLIRSKHLK